MYDIVPQIFLPDTSDGIDQINPDSIFSGFMGANDSMGGTGGMSFMPTMNVFSEMPNNPDLYESQYDIIAGHWPESHDEAVLVVSHNSRVTDFVLYSMGLRDRAEMRAMLEAVMNRSDIELEISESQGVYPYDTFLKMSFKVIHPAYLFQYDDLFDVWVDKSGDTEFMEDLLENSMDLKIVGIAQPRQDASTTVLAMGVNYTSELIHYLMRRAGETPIVKEQLANPEVNILSGRTFEDEKENPDSGFDFSKIISIDEDIFRDTLDMEDAFGSLDFSDMDFSSFDMGSLDFGNMDMGSMDLSGMDLSGLDLSGMDLSGMDFSNIDLSGMDLSNIDMSGMPPPEIDIGAIIQALENEVSLPPGMLAGIMGEIMQGFPAYLATLPPPLPPPFGDPTQWMMDAFNDYIMLPSTQLIIQEQLAQALESTALEEQITAAIQSVIMQAMQSYMAQMMTMIQDAMQAAISDAIGSAMEQMMGQLMTSLTTQIGGAIQTAMTGTMSQVSKQMQTAMAGIGDQIQDSIQSALEDMAEEMQSSMGGFDAEGLADAFQIELGEEEIFELMMSIMSPSETNFEQTLHKLGYADPDVPTQILIYPRSFEAKQEILDILDNYNERMEAEGKTEKVIHYTDIVGLMMSTVTDIIDMVSYALVAFVSVALIVSSIMIGVITFISVLERKKEIGILRAVGASKGNIRLVFNAETLIIGFVAGIIGVFATFGIIIVANIILYNELGIEQLVILPMGIPPVLVAISMFLTYIAGLIPASAAAGKAPVEALRSE